MLSCPAPGGRCGAPDPNLADRRTSRRLAGAVRGGSCPPQPVSFASAADDCARLNPDQGITNGNNPRNRARLIAFDSSRCLLAETAVVRLGTILPRSEMYRCSSFTSL